MFNLKFYKELTDERSDSGIPALIDFGSCSLHILDGAFQKRAEQSGWNLKTTLKSTWQLFHHSLTRRDNYETLTGSTTFPMAFCATRCVESMAVANRAVLILPNIVKRIDFWEKQPRSVLKSDNPMLLFLYFNLKSPLSALLKFFIKPTVIVAAKIGSSLINIHISKTSNQIPNKDLDLGFAAKAKLKELWSKDLVSVSQEGKFREEARTFLTHLVSKLFERAPLHSVVVRPAS